MPADVLLLDNHYQPITIVSYKRAIYLMLSDKVDLVEQYADKVIRSTNLVLPWPAVVALKQYVRRRTKTSAAAPCRSPAVLARDSYRCQYCGLRPKRAGGLPDTRVLTVDHVVPKVQAVDGLVVLPWSGERVPVHSWLNVTTACDPCNNRKGGRTPDQAGMKLLRLPRVPNTFDLVRIALSRRSVPDEWRGHLR